MGASVRELRDLELMLKIVAEGDEEGWIETEEIARSMGFDRARDLGVRLSWMRRYGMLEFDEQRRMWRLSEGGERVSKARLRAAQANALEKLPDESMIEVMSSITTHYRHADPMTAVMLRREFAYGTRPGYLSGNGRRR